MSASSSRSTTPYGFPLLLDLAVGCWEYECSLNENFRKFAKEGRDKWQTSCPEEFREGNLRIRRRRHIDWMFVAFVFEWQDIFQTKSARVVIRFDPRDGDGSQKTQKFAKIFQRYDQIW